MPAPSGDRATLSRDLADFLIELSIALHKHAMYPEGHPSLAPAAAGLTRRAALLLEDRATVSLGVARNQLVIEGVATDPKHPVLRELAGRLHRHHLGAITFRRGVEQEEVADALRTLAIEAERTGQPLGLGDRDRLAAWPHVQLHPLTYERLELTDQDGSPAREGDARAAQLWVGLARAALATAPEDTRPTPTEPAVIAQAINEHSKAEATGYDQVIVGYLLQIAAELKTAGSAEAAALRRRTSRLIRTLKPETLQRLVGMGGDFAQRRQFVSRGRRHGRGCGTRHPQGCRGELAGGHLSFARAPAIETGGARRGGRRTCATASRCGVARAGPAAIGGVDAARSESRSVRRGAATHGASRPGRDAAQRSPCDRARSSRGDGAGDRHHRTAPPRGGRPGRGRGPARAAARRP